MKAATAAIERLDGVQSATIKKGATSTITMKAGKTLTKEDVQKVLTALEKDPPFTVTAFAVKAKEVEKKGDDTKADDKKAGDDKKADEKKSDKKDTDKK